MAAVSLVYNEYSLELIALTTLSLSLFNLSMLNWS